MVYSFEFSRPSSYHIGTSRFRSSSLNRYPSPDRSSHVSSSRASTPMASYGSSALRTSQETSDSPYSSHRSSLSSTNSSSGRSSFSRESPTPTLRTFLQETVASPNSCRRDSLSSLSTSGSSRRSSFSRNSPTTKKKHVHFKDEETDTDTTTSLMSNGRACNLESIQGLNRKRDISSPMHSFDDIRDGIGKLSVSERYPSGSSDACRRRQARAAYLSALDDTGIIIKGRDTM